MDKLKVLLAYWSVGIIMLLLAYAFTQDHRFGMAAGGVYLVGLLGTLFKVFPIIIWEKMKDSWGKNWVLLVKMHPDSELPAAIVGQEIWEARHKVNPINWLRVRFTDSGQREMEYMGHEISVQAAVAIYGTDEKKYRRWHAEIMYDNYQRVFREVGVEGVIAEMKKRSSDAREWVDDHKEKLREYAK